jgi:predicted nucleic acid-binding protein
MHSRIYFDTNVIVDLFDVKRPFHEYSVTVFKKIFEDEDMDVFINTDTLTNLFYILRSHMKFSFDDAIEKLEFVKNAFTVISTELNEIDRTLEICKEYVFNDYEDAMQYVCALKEGCTLIITNNAKDFKNASIEIVTSKELALDMKR